MFINTASIICIVLMSSGSLLPATFRGTVIDGIKFNAHVSSFNDKTIQVVRVMYDEKECYIWFRDSVLTVKLDNPEIADIHDIQAGEWTIDLEDMD